MSIHGVLREVLALTRLTIPKPGKLDALALGSAFPQLEVRAASVYETFGDLVEDHGETWCIRCSHRCQPGASEAAICQAEHQLGFALPGEMHSLLRFANGVELFVVVPVGLKYVSFNVRYRLFGTEQLVSKNRDLLQYFRSALGNDPDFRDIERLNYLAFGDSANGNYLAILLEGRDAGKVFHLELELCARPYGDLDADLYYTLANSLEGWLKLLRDTEGWADGGLGCSVLAQS